MTFERSQISLAVEQNVNQFPELWSPSAYADHLAKAKAKAKGKKIAMAETAPPRAPENEMAWLSRGSRTGQMTEMESEADADLKVANKFKGRLLKPTGGAVLGNIGRGPKKKLVKAGNNVIFHGYVREGSGPSKKAGFDISASLFHVKGLLRQGFYVRGMGPDERGLPRWFVHESSRPKVESAESVPHGVQPTATVLREGKFLGNPTTAKLKSLYKKAAKKNKKMADEHVRAFVGNPDPKVGWHQLQGAERRDLAAELQRIIDGKSSYGAAGEDRAPGAAVLREDADSPEGATGGFNRHQKLMSPDTRELVLKSRATEIEAFANDRGYDPQIVFAIAEVSSRMGRVPDLRQYGVYGEEAKAIRHFIAGDILNLAIEDAAPSASILVEATRRRRRRGSAGVGTQFFIMANPQPYIQTDRASLAQVRKVMGNGVVVTGFASNTIDARSRMGSLVRRELGDKNIDGDYFKAIALVNDKTRELARKAYGGPLDNALGTAEVIRRAKALRGKNEDERVSVSILRENSPGPFDEAIYNIHATPSAAAAGSDVQKLAQQIAAAIAPSLRGRYQTVQAQDVFGQAKSIHIRSGNITPEMIKHNVAWHNDPFQFSATVSGFNKDGSAGPKITAEQLAGHHAKKKMRKKSVKPGKEHLLVNHIKKYVAGLMKDAPAPRAEGRAPLASILAEGGGALTEAAGKAAGKTTVKGKVSFTRAGGALPTIVMMLDGIHLAGPRGWMLDPAFGTWKQLVARHKSLKTVARGKTKTVNTTVEFYKSSNDYKILVYIGGVLLAGYYIDPAFDLWKRLLAKYPQLSSVVESDDGMVGAARALPQFTELLNYRDDRAAPLVEAKAVIAQSWAFKKKGSASKFKDLVNAMAKREKGDWSARLNKVGLKVAVEHQGPMPKALHRKLDQLASAHYGQRDKTVYEDTQLVEVSPPGFSGTVKAMKDGHPEIDNPWALSWHMYGQGAKPRRKPEKGKPRYKSPGQYAADKKKAEGEDNLRVTQARFYEIMGCRLTQAQQPTKHVF